MNPIKKKNINNVFDKFLIGGRGCLGESQCLLRGNVQSFKTPVSGPTWQRPDVIQMFLKPQHPVLSSVPHEEDGAILFLLRGARADHRLQVGRQLVEGLETQEWNVEFVC